MQSAAYCVLRHAECDNFDAKIEKYKVSNIFLTYFMVIFIESRNFYEY